MYDAGKGAILKITGAVLETMGLPRPYVESQPLKIMQLELDDPGPNEVLIKIGAAGLCHSDLSVVEGNRPRQMPMLIGHEASGTVVSVGEGVIDLLPGQQVSTVFLPRCEQCENCRTNGKIPCAPGSAVNNAGLLVGNNIRLHDGKRDVYHHAGVSSFATHAVLHRSSVVPVGNDVPPEVAAVLGCAVLTGGGAVINAGNPQMGDDVIVVGLGGVGMAALITAVSLNKGKVIGIDANPDKLTLARDFGAAETYTPNAAIAAGIKAAVVVEAAGHPKAFESAVQLTGVGGTTVTVGLPSPDARSTITPLGITAEARTIVGSYLGSAVPARDIPIYEQLWREGKLPVEKLISGRISLNEVNRGLDELADGHAVRQIIVF